MRANMFSLLKKYSFVLRSNIVSFRCHSNNLFDINITELERVQLLKIVSVANFNLM